MHFVDYYANPPRAIYQARVSQQRAVEDCCVTLASLPEEFHEMAYLLAEGWTEREIAVLLKTSRKAVRTAIRKLHEYFPPEP